ncbi:MAG: four helix bundle protein [Cyclobacteriaceae bacterium]|jgi:four helix bundle protein
MAAGSFRDLTVYKKAFELAMEVFKVSKSFPTEEKYSLTDQVRRSSRAVCSCIGEAYRKRNYKAHFVSKSTDADMENTETRVWFDFALACNYITNEKWNDLELKAEEVGKLLNHMIENPEKYDRKSKK